MATDTLDPPKAARPQPRSVTVEAGEFCIWRTRTGEGTITGGTRERGGWFKCSSDEEVNYENPLLVKVLESFTYERDRGARRHAIKFERLKFWSSIDQKPIAVTAAVEHAMHQQHLQAAQVFGEKISVEEMAKKIEANKTFHF